jgi:hypothetical protein
LPHEGGPSGTHWHEDVPVAHSIASGQLPPQVGKVSPQASGVGMQAQPVAVGVHVSVAVRHTPPQLPLASGLQGRTHSADGPGQQLVAPVASRHTQACSHTPFRQWSTVQALLSLQSASVWQGCPGSVVVVVVVVTTVMVVVVTQSGPGPQHEVPLVGSTQMQSCSHAPFTHRSTVQPLPSSQSASVWQLAPQAPS